MLAYYARNIGYLNVAIESTFRINDYYRAVFAKTETTCMNNLYLFFETVILNLVFKYLNDFL